LVLVVVQNGWLYAQGGGLESIGGKLNHDSFILCREIRTKFRESRGQRSMFTKAYEVHQMADNIHRMIVLKAPVRGMDQALFDLSLLVDDLEQSVKATRLPAFREPVTIPKGPNGYIFYGGNGYPRASFQCNGFPCQRAAEQGTCVLCDTLQEMKSAISQLQRHYAPRPRRELERRPFPVPSPVPLTDSDWRPQSQPQFQPQPLRLPPPPIKEPVKRPIKKPLQEQNDSRWKPSRPSAPVFPSAPPANRSVPSQKGPELLPPRPAVS